ncbi:MAG: hypothetical protein AAFQ75_15565 [Pseudomonadota bacterium]
MYTGTFDPDAVHAHRLAEAAQGFPLLRGCPNTAAIRKLRALDALDEGAQTGLFEEWRALAKRATGGKLPYEILVGEPEAFPLTVAYQQQSAGDPATKDLGTLPVKLIAGIRKDSAIGGLEGWARSMDLPDTALHPTERFAPSLDALVPADPRKLRKALAETTGERFGATAEKASGEQTYYTGAIEDWGVALDVTFARSGGAARTGQLDYQVWVLPPGGKRERIGPYEALWGLPSGWDYVTEAGLTAATAHLCDVALALLALHRTAGN